MLTLIVARGTNGAIGKENTIPWRLPEDLAFFKRETLGGTVIMGRRTWESLPFKPLKNRENFVVSRDPSVHDHVFETPRSAVKAAYANGCRRVYGIGGQSVYADLLSISDRLLLTEVDVLVEDADAYFPEFDETNWIEIGRFQLNGPGPAATVRELLKQRGSGLE